MRPLKLYERFFDARLLERFMAKVEMPSQFGACWTWTSTLDHNGYGKMSVGQRRDPDLPQKMVTAHRLAFALAYGIDALPDGKPLDHLCNNIRCVNPIHLELVTHAENNRRKLARAAAAEMTS